jgi:hypothetical protein
MPLKQSIVFPERVSPDDWAKVRSAAILHGKTVGEYIWAAVESKLAKEPKTK